MAIHNKIASAIEVYMVNRDIEALQSVIDIVRDELNDPSIQEAILKVPIDKDSIGRVVFNEGFIRLPVDDVEADGPVYEDKLIRIICTDQPDNSVIILNVGHLDDKFIKLFPIGGFA